MQDGDVIVVIERKESGMKKIKKFQILRQLFQNLESYYKQII